ncbi:class I SAM-dependent methyltransferase [Bellilinea sp.]|uniref:class I SAM-dependent methyltransferase n=1 Tax=Bellilinea sp. TaxID=2838785 RepID=UPI002ADDEE5C|nr:methyltransferase domain-containing protein [Bellilinea sp.]
METWGTGNPYERYVGRWSRIVASQFLTWLDLPSGQIWGDVGCGTGALIESILILSEPASIFAIDQSEGFIFAAKHTITDQRVRFGLANATALPWVSSSFNVTVAGLVLNFVSDARAMVQEMVRVTQSKGKVAAYVWDYAGGMQMMRQFWDAAIEVTPDDARLDQAERFPICQPEPLISLFRDAGLRSPEVHAIEIETIFKDFDDYWSPFLGKQGAAPTYLASLEIEKRDRIREVLRTRLIFSVDGSITLSARAWAVQGLV